MKLFRIAALMFFAAATPALAQVRVATLAHEASSAMIRLPDFETDELTLQICVTCKVLRLRASAATSYLVGDEEVTLASIKKYLAEHPDAPVVVSQPLNELTLWRVRVSATTPAR
jgi:hypothetical protein